MPLTTDDLTQILTTAIVQLKFAKEDAAPGLAKTLAQAIVTPINALQDDAPALAPASVQSTTFAEWINVRNMIAHAIGTDDQSFIAAEKLLTLSYIDVPAIMAMRVEDDVLSTTAMPPTTGVQTVSPATGSVGV